MLGRAVTVGATAILLGGSSPARADFLSDAIQSRERLPVFLAKYREQIKLYAPPSFKDVGHPGWGMSDSDMVIEAGLDGRSSHLRYETFTPEEPAVSGGVRTFFNSGARVWKSVEGEMRGSFGSRPSGMFNPAAAGYEFECQPLVKFISGRRYHVEGDMAVFTNAHGSKTLYFSTDLPRRVAKGISRDTTANTEVVQEVEEWFDWQGAKFPKRATLSIFESGQLVQKRTYSLQKVNEPPTRLQFPLRENATFTDDETGIGYIVRKGRLIRDPRDRTEPRQLTTLRRSSLIGGFSLLGLLAYGLVRRRRRRPHSHLVADS